MSSAAVSWFIVSDTFLHTCGRYTHELLPHCRATWYECKHHRNSEQVTPPSQESRTGGERRCMTNGQCAKDANTYSIFESHRSRSGTQRTRTEIHTQPVATIHFSTHTASSHSSAPRGTSVGANRNTRPRPYKHHTTRGTFR